MPMRMVRAALVDALIYGRLVGRLRDRFALFASDIYPQISGNLHFSKGVFGRGAELGAKWEIGNIGNVCRVLFAALSISFRASMVAGPSLIAMEAGRPARSG